MKLIKRDYYLKKLLSVKDVPDIKVITGVRRSGKSKLMDAFIDLISADDKANIVRIKLNLKKFEKLLDADRLYDYIEQQYVEDKTNYLFVDEIHLLHNYCAMLILCRGVNLSDPPLVKSVFGGTYSQVQHLANVGKAEQRLLCRSCCSDASELLIVENLNVIHTIAVIKT